MPSSYAVGNHFENLIERLINSGRFQSKSEVVREGLRLLEEREQERKVKIEELRAAVQRGIESGGYVPADEFLGKLRKKYDKMAKTERQ